MRGVTLLFVHGWGFDRSIWDAMRGEFPDSAMEFADLGYFGARCWPEVDRPAVAVGHSVGSLLLLRNPPRDCRALVAINGFDRFAVGRPLDRMIDRFAVAPADVLAEFRRRCGDGVAGDADWDRLGEDLRLLRDADERGASQAWRAPILSLQADDDPILPGPLRVGAFDGAGDVRRAASAAGGHCLPASRPGWCAAQVRALLDELA